MLQMIAIIRPGIFHGFVWSYTLFLFSTPFLVLSILFSLGYVHFYAPDLNRAAGSAASVP